jgi:glycosyl transferase family 25
VNESIVVLEDDCELTDDFEAGIRYLEKFVDQISLVRIEPLEKQFFLTSRKDPDFSLVKQVNVGMGTSGYVVTPRGAKKLLENGRTIRTPIDLYLKYTFMHDQLNYALVPHGVNPTYEDSIIGVDFRNYREKGAMLDFKRFAYKTFYVLANLYTNLVNGVKRF